MSKKILIVDDVPEKLLALQVVLQELNQVAVVAVNSGAGGGTEVLARVDLIASWIQRRIDNNRSWCGSSTCFVRTGMVI
jgi:CheY-like chemotaxis protein